MFKIHSFILSKAMCAVLVTADVSSTMPFSLKISNQNQRYPKYIRNSQNSIAKQ